MRQETIVKTWFKFDELTDKARDNAVEKLAYINVEGFEWWDSVYYDAETIGIKITEFDIDRGSFCEIELVKYKTWEDVADLIKENHGENCETYKTAEQFLSARELLVEKWSDGKNKNTVAEGNEWDFDNDLDDLEDNFRKNLSEDYRIMLQKEYEYLTSREGIIETIEENEYEFDENGNL